MYKLVHNVIDREKILMTRQADKNYGKCYMDQYIIFLPPCKFLPSQVPLRVREQISHGVDSLVKVLHHCDNG